MLNYAGDAGVLGDSRHSSLPQASFVGRSRSGVDGSARDHSLITSRLREGKGNAIFTLRQNLTY